ECDRLLVLPPAVELSEDALFRFAELVSADPNGEAVSAPVYDALATGMKGEDSDGGRVWLTRPDRLTDDFPDDLSADALGGWVQAGVPELARRQTERVLAYPVQQTPLIDRARVGPTPPPPADRLVLAGDLVGITGWDHITYAVLRGLPSVGVKLVRHGIS